MKKLLFFLFAAIVLVACDGCDPINPPDPPVIKYYTITGIAGPHGAISPSTVTVEKGKSATFKITPDSGYVIASLKNDGNVLPPLDTYTVKNISENDTFEVEFKYKYEEGTPEWYLTQFIWKGDSVNTIFGNNWYEEPDYPRSTLTFNPDGSFINFWNNKNYPGKWSLDKSSTPFLLVYDSGVSYKIQILNEKKLILLITSLDGLIGRFTYINDTKRRFN